MLRVVADELGALRIVPDRVAHAPQRRADEGVHQHGRHQRPRRDDVIDLQLRSEVEPEEFRRPGSVGRDALLAAEVTRQHERGRIDQLADSQRDQREDRAGPPGRHGPEQQAEQQARRGAGERDERQRNRQAVVDGTQEVNRRIAAETEVDGMAEGQQAGLAQQHVVRKREDRRDSHLAQQRVARRGGETRDMRQHGEDGRGGEPGTVPACPAHARRRERRGSGGERAGGLHASRVPRRPRGRTTSISTSSRYGTMGAAVATLIAQNSYQGDARATEMPRTLEEIEERIVHRDGKGLHDADEHRRDQRTRERAQAPHHHDDEDDRTEEMRQRRLGEPHEAADDPREPRERTADGEDQHEDAGHVVPERAHHLRMGQRGLDDEADARPLERQVEEYEHGDGDRHHESLVRREARAEQREQREIDALGHAVGDGVPAPEHRDELLDQVGKTEGEEDLGDVPLAVHVTQAVALDRRADQAARERRQDQRGPEADPAPELERAIRAEHEDARVGEIEHAHHAEDQREAARQHEQQQAVHDAVQQRNRRELEHSLRQWRRPLLPRRNAAAQACAARVTSGAPSCTSWAARWPCRRPWRRSSTRGWCPRHRI